jgi:hypothetical protein
MHELYQDRAWGLPYHAAEVLTDEQWLRTRLAVNEEVEFKPPAVGLISDVGYIFKTAAVARAARIPDEGTWFLKEFKANGMPQGTYSKMIRKLRNQAEAGADTLTYMNKTIPKSALKELSGAYGIDEKYAPDILAEYWATRVEKPDGVSTYTDLIADGIPESRIDKLLKILKDEKFVFWKIIGILNIHHSIDISE